ncbi:MAG: hypothetical protein ACYC4S_00685 [Rhodoferax sp.]
MITTLQILHWIAGLVILAEALNKLERTHPLSPGLTHRQRLVDLLKVVAWTLLALGGGAAVAAPLLLVLGVQSGQLLLLRLENPMLAETAVLLGFGVLIVRTRVKEDVPIARKRRTGDPA